jgi:long-chain fatty acid transport protein
VFGWRRPWPPGSRGEPEALESVRDPTPKTTLRLAAGLLLVSWAAAAHAGGLSLYEIGTPDLGLAAAGYASRAQDASTVLTNPAGMTRLDGMELMLAGQGLYGVAQFTPGAATTPRLGTDGGGNAIGFLPGGSAFFVWSPTRDLRVGLGLFSNFGLAESYDAAWVGRYYVQSATLLGLSVMPAAAYRVADWLSLGASMNVMYGILKDQVAIDNLDPARGDGTLKLDASAWGVGGEFGVLLEPAKGTRIGATYSTAVSLDFGATPSLANVADRLQGALQKPLTLGLKVPQGVMVSLYQEVTPALALLANFGWQDWSSFGKVDVQLANEAQTSATVQLHYVDSWHGALGAQIRVAPTWLLSTGVSFDSSIVSDQDRTPSLPLGASWRIAAGVQHPVSDSVELGAAYEFLWCGDLPMDQQRGPLSGRLEGTYRGVMLNFFAVNVKWRL